jgi:glycosyltransferase involved in cell wall biosynthesis
MTTPRVTVLIGTHNHQRFVEEAMTSVLAQDFPASDMEIQVVDDGSTDRTLEIVRKFEPRVRLIRKENQASAFNPGIPEARSWHFSTATTGGCRINCPRRWKPSPRIFSLGIAGNGSVMVQLDGSMQSEILRENFKFQANPVEGDTLFRLRKSFLSTSRITIHRDLLQRIGAVPDILRVAADEYRLTLATVLMQVEILPDAVTYYRYHDANGFQMSTPDPAHLRKKAAPLGKLSAAAAFVGLYSYSIYGREFSGFIPNAVFSSSCIFDCRALRVSLGMSCDAWSSALLWRGSSSFQYCSCATHSSRRRSCFSRARRCGDPLRGAAARRRRGRFAGTIPESGEGWRKNWASLRPSSSCLGAERQGSFF